MIGEYVKLPNGDYGFVAEERGDMLLVFGDWDVALPCAVKACDVTPADDDAWQSSLETLREECAANLDNKYPQLRSLARVALKMVHHVTNAEKTKLDHHEIDTIHSILKGAGIGILHDGRCCSIPERVELLAVKATANEVHSEHAQADLNAEGTALDKALAEVEEVNSVIALVEKERDAERTKFQVAYRRSVALMMLLRSDNHQCDEQDFARIARDSSTGILNQELATFLAEAEAYRQETFQPLRDRIAELERNAQAMKTSLDLHEQWERDIRTLVLKHTFLADAGHSHAHLVEQAFEVMESRLESLRDIMNGKLDNTSAECERLREQVKSGRNDEVEHAHPTDPAPAPREDEQDADESPESSKAAPVDASTDDDNEFAAHVEITSGAYTRQRAHVRSSVKGSKLRVRLDASGKEDLVMRDDVRVLDGVLPEPVASTPRTKREPVVVTSEEMTAVMAAVDSKPGLRSDIASRAGVSDEVVTAALDALFVAGKLIKPVARGKGAVWKPAPVEVKPIETATVEADSVQVSLF